MCVKFPTPWQYLSTILAVLAVVMVRSDASCRPMYTVMIAVCGWVEKYGSVMAVRVEGDRKRKCLGKCKGHTNVHIHLTGV